MKAGTGRIVIGVVILLVGAVGVPITVAMQLIFEDRHETKFVAPGSTEVHLPEPGAYYLWNDYQTLHEGRAYNRSPELPDGLEIRIRNAETGEPIELKPSGGSVSVQSGGTGSEAIGSISVPQPTSLRITTRGIDHQRVLSLSRFSMSRLLGYIFGGLAVAGVSGLLGVGLIVWGVIVNARARRQTAE